MITETDKQLKAIHQELNKLNKSFDAVIRILNRDVNMRERVLNNCCQKPDEYDGTTSVKDYMDRITRESLNAFPKEDIDEQRN